MKELLKTFFDNVLYFLARIQMSFDFSFVKILEKWLQKTEFVSNKHQTYAPLLILIEVFSVDKLLLRLLAEFSLLRNQNSYLKNGL